MKSIEPFMPGEEFYTEERCYITELHNNDGDKDCSIARARVEPGITTHPHLLKGAIERYVILEGVAEVSIGEAAPVRVRPLDVVTIPAGVRQSITNVGEIDLVFLCICTPRFRQQDYLELKD